MASGSDGGGGGGVLEEEQTDPVLSGVAVVEVVSVTIPGHGTQTKMVRDTIRN